MTEICAIVVHFIPSRKGAETNKLADAELHFNCGPMKGLRLCGFGVWGHDHKATNVTFPKRTYHTRNRETRDYVLLKPQHGYASSQVNILSGLILDAFNAETLHE